MDKRIRRTLSMFAFSLSLLTELSAHAEMYVAGQVGVTVPQRFSNVEVSGTGIPNGSRYSNLDLQNSVMYGAKVGYFFDSMKWLGVETEVFNTTPHFKQQNATLTVPGGGSATVPLTGQDVRVLTWTPVNLIARYQAGALEPYVGVGLGVFFARIKDGGTGETSSSTRPGLNTQVGLRYRVTQQIALFGEWKFNHANLSFEPSTPTEATGGVKGDYNVHHLVFGVGLHFN